MTPFDNPRFDDHEDVHHFHDPVTGLRAIIALHSTALGPAAGGCRLWRYDSPEAALTDALRLSRGMTYKNAMAGLPFGGGKSVIINGDDVEAGPALFQAFGRCVDALGGRYITAEDVGVSVQDMLQVRSQTAYVSGLPSSGDAAGGDPSPWTAEGVFLGLKAAVAHHLKQESLEGLTVAVQGVGHVGMHLCEKLHAAGARLIVADVNVAALDQAHQQFGAQIVAIDDILGADAEVFAPCALGAILNEQSIPRLRARVIAGAANNQLAEDVDGERLVERGILYAPDYVINAGGIISVAGEYLKGSTARQVGEQIQKIPQRLTRIFDDAVRTGKPTNQVADEAARAIVARAAVSRRQASQEICAS